MWGILVLSAFSCPGPPRVRDPSPVSLTSFFPGCCHQRCRDPSAPRAHRPRQLPPQAYWPLAYLGPLGGSSWGPQPPVHQQQWQPQSPPPGPLRQRLCPVHQAQKGRPAASAAPRGSASAPQSLPASTSAPAMATATATANSSSPVPPSATATVLEPGPPTDARPLPAPAACGPFTSSTGAHPPFPSQGAVPVEALSPPLLASLWAACPSACPVTEGWPWGFI